MLLTIAQVSVFLAVLLMDAAAALTPAAPAQEWPISPANMLLACVGTLVSVIVWFQARDRAKDVKIEELWKSAVENKAKLAEVIGENRALQAQLQGLQEQIKILREHIEKLERPAPASHLSPA